MRRKREAHSKPRTGLYTPRYGGLERGVYENEAKRNAAETLRNTCSSLDSVVLNVIRNIKAACRATLVKGCTR